MTLLLETHPSLIAVNPTTRLHQTSLVFINSFLLVGIPYHELQYQSNLSSVVMVCAYFKFLLVSGRLIDRRLSSKSLDHHRRMLDFFTRETKDAVFIKSKELSNQSHYQQKTSALNFELRDRLESSCNLRLRKEGALTFYRTQVRS